MNHWITYHLLCLFIWRECLYLSWEHRHVKRKYTDVYILVLLKLYRCFFSSVYIHQSFNVQFVASFRNCFIIYEVFNPLNAEAFFRNNQGRIYTSSSVFRIDQRNCTTRPHVLHLNNQGRIYTSLLYPPSN